MKTVTNHLGVYGFLAVALGILPAGCPPQPAHCTALEQMLVGTWVGVPLVEGLPAEIITLSANHVYSSTYEGYSASEVGRWSLGYDPEDYYCDVLFVADSNGVIHTTYSIRMDGEYMVLDSWGTGETYYYREGGSPPPAAE
jgi:hypothetical protein